ncbi:hypothetical protein NHX12_002222 [Muraenolepis orangiensis]|uniref:Tetratricopeptide repeat protein 38 n=1 Tax=Muraenolepis orangiensis TaxID=630683 RepID=A0A9Q0DWV1_9TELE|nr:hypothetical protein NHX12_002222 [Muraenolepis orangiensis]
MGHVMSTGLELVGTGSSVRLNQRLASAVKTTVELASAQDITPREKLHARAVKLFSMGNFPDACDVWESILVEHPTDLLALKFAHDGYFYMGAQAQMRDSVSLPPTFSHYPLPSVTTPYPQSLPPTFSHYPLPSVTTPYPQSLPPTLSHYPLPSVTTHYPQSLPTTLTHYPLPSVTTHYPQSLPPTLSHYPLPSLTTHYPQSLPTTLSHYPLPSVTTPYPQSLPTTLSHYPYPQSLPTTLTHYPLPSVTTHYPQSLPTTLSHYPLPSVTTPYPQSLPTTLSHYPLPSVTTPYPQSLPTTLSHYPLPSVTTHYPHSLPTTLSHYPLPSVTTHYPQSLPPTLTHYPLPSVTTHYPHYLKGLYSFGLLETHFYDEAEKVAKEGLAMRRDDAWCVHSVAHVHEMKGEVDKGLAFMETTEKDWQGCDMLACHNYWHWALCFIEKGDYEAALSLYDSKVSRSCKSTGGMLDTVDSCSLLYRLQMEGVCVKDRWRELLQITKPHTDDHVTLFNDAHFLMASLGAREADVSQRLLEGLRDVAKDPGDNYQHQLSQTLGVPLCEAMVEYDEGNYSRTVELLQPLRYRMMQIGGSDRDVFNLLLIQAAMKSSSEHHQKLARCLLVERDAQKLSSPLNSRLIQRARALHS